MTIKLCDLVNVVSHRKKRLEKHWRKTHPQNRNSQILPHSTPGQRVKKIKTGEIRISHSLRPSFADLTPGSEADKQPTRRKININCQACFRDRRESASERIFQIFLSLSHGALRKRDFRFHSEFERAVHKTQKWQTKAKLVNNFTQEASTKQGW